ncbi:MAG TPA: DUF3794 domain-containing protein [Oscillospiraceae bacterium]|jgi:hypothetical protein|nr:DUF3794 domain-containing protein [Oscillospiraceae bacterium]HRW56152.1 DUF3794 domain-containing protein [Oscillospiraceae bacterium]
MELNAVRQTITACRGVKECREEIPFDCGMTLPDYYPDVMKILRCGAEVFFGPPSGNQGGVEVSGTITATVCYLSEEGKLCGWSQKVPFTKALSLQGEEPAAVCAKVLAREVRCRALNKRRVEVSGTVSLGCTELITAPEEVLGSVDGKEIHLLHGALPFVNISGEFYRRFTFREDIPPEEGKPKVGNIIRSFAAAKVTECRTVTDKIITKGELSVSILWTPEEGENGSDVIISQYTFPVSQIIDAPGVTGAHTCDARYIAAPPDLTVAEDGGMTLEVKIGAFARTYSENNTDIVCDMFSTECDCTCDKERIETVGKVVPVAETMEVRERAELPESAKSVIACWVEPGPPPECDEAGNLVARPKFCMFARDEDGIPEYFEKTFEQKTGANIPPGSTVPLTDVDMTTENASASISEGGAEIRFTLILDGSIFLMDSAEAVTDCTFGERAPSGTKRMPLIIYYAGGDETLWQIAKKYRSAPELIAEENGLTDSIPAAGTALLIPR